MGCRGGDDADKPSGMEEKSHPQHEGRSKNK